MGSERNSNLHNGLRLACLFGGIALTADSGLGILNDRLEKEARTVAQAIAESRNTCTLSLAALGQSLGTRTIEATVVLDQNDAPPELISRTGSLANITFADKPSANGIYATWTNSATDAFDSYQSSTAGNVVSIPLSILPNEARMIHVFHQNSVEYEVDGPLYKSTQGVANGYVPCGAFLFTPSKEPQIL